MPPERITNVIPTATIALMLVCWAMFSRFETVRKCGVSTHSTRREDQQPDDRAELRARPSTQRRRQAVRSARASPSAARQHAFLRRVGGVELAWMRPRRITRMRSLMPSNSGSSDEIMMMPAPGAVRRFIRW